jgi:hypothetical protein
MVAAPSNLQKRGSEWLRCEDATNDGWAMTADELEKRNIAKMGEAGLFNEQ